MERISQHSTRGMILEELFKELSKREVSIYLFSKQTGIPSGRVYKWKDRGSTPKPEDEAKIREWMTGKLYTNSSVQSMVSEDSTQDYQAKYIRLLETTKETLETVLKVNLSAMVDSQAHLRALSVTQLNQLAKIRSASEKRPLAKVQAEINKEIADAVLSGLETGIPEGIQGRG